MSRFFEGQIKLLRGANVAANNASFRRPDGTIDDRVIQIRQHAIEDDVRFVRFIRAGTGAEALGYMHSVLQSKHRLLPDGYEVLSFGDVHTGLRDEVVSEYDLPAGANVVTDPVGRRTNAATVEMFSEEELARCKR